MAGDQHGDGWKCRYWYKIKFGRHWPKWLVKKQKTTTTSTTCIDHAEEVMNS